MIGFLPKVFAQSMTGIGFDLLIRVFILLAFVFFVFISIMFEYIISAVDNSAEKPFVVEEKRIHY